MTQHPQQPQQLVPIARIAKIDSLFREWKRKRQLEEVVAPVAAVTALVLRAENKGGKPAVRTEAVAARPFKPQPIPADAVIFPASVALQPIDPLYRGLRGLTGKVPANWTRYNWLFATHERMKHTDDPLALNALRAEIDAITGKTISDELT